MSTSQIFDVESARATAEAGAKPDATDEQKRAGEALVDELTQLFAIFIPVGAVVTMDADRKKLFVCGGEDMLKALLSRRLQFDKEYAPRLFAAICEKFPNVLQEKLKEMAHQEEGRKYFRLIADTYEGTEEAPKNNENAAAAVSVSDDDEEEKKENEENNMAVREHTAVEVGDENNASVTNVD